MTRISWGPRGERRRREFTDPVGAKRFLRRVVDTTTAKDLEAARTPSGAVYRAERVLSELPGVSAEALVEAYRTLHEKTTQGRRTDSIVEDLIKNAAHNGRSIRHIQTLRHHLRRFARAFRKPISDIAASEIDCYLRQMGNPKTRNNHRISAVALFGYARKKGDLPYDKATEAEKTESAKVVRDEPDVIACDDLEKLLKASTDPRLTMFLLLGAFTGCRTAEILRLTWKHITPGGLLLTPDITKTSRRRVVEIPDNMTLWLESIPRGSDGGFVSFHHAGPLYEKLGDLCSGVGVLWVDNGLRHGYVSHHLEKYGDAIRTSKNTGHSLRVLETDYLKLVPKSEADKWFNIIPSKK